MLRRLPVQAFASLIAVTSAVVSALLFALPAQAYPEYTRNPEIAETVKVPIAKWWDSAVPEKGIILAVHGLTLCGDAFDVTARELTQKGYTVYAFDMRGFGRWREEAAKYNDPGTVNYEFIRRDLIKVSRTIRERFPESKLFLMGESLGANLSVWLATQSPQLADGLVLSALCYKTRFHPRWRWLADVPAGFVMPNAPMKLSPYVKPSLSTDPEVTEKYLKDPSISHELSIVTLVKGQLTNRIALKEVEKLPEKLPILILCGEEDGLFKTKALDGVIKRMGSKRIDFRVLPGTGHLILECQKPGGNISSVIADWIANPDAKTAQNPTTLPGKASGSKTSDAKAAERTDSTKPAGPEVKTESDAKIDADLKTDAEPKRRKQARVDRKLDTRDVTSRVGEDIIPN